MRRASSARQIPVLVIALALLCAGAGLAPADDTAAAPGAALRARYAALQENLRNNQFRRPLHLESSEGQSEVTGDVYALVDSPFESAGPALGAGAGPMDTRDYRISLEAVPVEDGKTFIHLGYSYGYGNFGRLAMQTYLATLGRNKVGFTVVGAQPDGRNRYIGGLRGVVERNAMRYYAAIEAFLGAQSGSSQSRFEKRIRDWYAMTELFPRQLHELGQEEYLDMKRVENPRYQDYDRPRS
jgi:hypothetical protein